MNAQHINIEKAEEKLNVLEKEGKTVMIMTIDGKLAGIIEVADTVKEISKQAI